MSLSALGIRIIAPIPGRGTIGIEVPNKNPSIVSMRSVIASPKFQSAEMELPLALGKTIKTQTSNGGWPWFPGMKENRYITQHIITGMGHLDHLGIKDVRENHKTWAMVKAQS